MSMRARKLTIEFIGTFFLMLAGEQERPVMGTRRAEGELDLRAA